MILQAGTLHQVRVHSCEVPHALGSATPSVNKCVWSLLRGPSFKCPRDRSRGCMCLASAVIMEQLLVNQSFPVLRATGSSLVQQGEECHTQQ